jgi:hypothetical protein
MLCAELEKTAVTKGVVKKSMSKGSDIATPSVFALLVDVTITTELDPEAGLIVKNDKNG